MIPDGIASYSHRQIEDMATDHLKRRVDVPFVAPVNMERLIEYHTGIEYKLRDGLKANFWVEGCVCREVFMSPELTVYVDAMVYCGPWPAYNAVLAEEYAHIRLHGSLFLCVETIEDFIELRHHRRWREFERDAKLFSTAIRMPAELVIQEAEKVYPKLVDDLGFAEPAVVEKQLRNRLSQTFRVLPDEMFKRMTTWPCDLRNRLRNSLQARSLFLLPETWTVQPSSGIPRAKYLDARRSLGQDSN